ncbi:MAG: glycosyltransferase family 39 protein [Candidatus Moranbacteria bacterium]|nr:glycosyltransferase family 39 protein [Candidatus Moranbacteria bacterium]
MQKFLEKNYRLIIIAILGFIAIVSVLNARNDSLIYDEDAHIPAGYSYLTQHDIRLNPEHPPLLKDLSALPLLFIRPNFDTTQDFWTTDNADNGQWNAGKNFLFGSGNDPDEIIFLSRLPIILLSLLLGLFIFKWTREMAGLTAGLFALTLYAFDPNILGHNHFVTTDLGIAAFTAFALYYFLRFIKEPTGKNILLAGLFLGLVQLVKFSSVLLFPVFGLLIILYPLVRLHREKSRLKIIAGYAWKGLAVFSLSIAVVWIGYFANTYAMPQTKLVEIMDHYMKPDDPRPLTVHTREIIRNINNYPALAPLADYIFGIARVFQRVGGGNITYFMGEISNQGFLSYFPVVFLIKEPLPILVLLLFSISVGLFGIAKSSFTQTRKIPSALVHYLRTYTAEFAMLSFIFIYILTSITGRLNIGLRHLFPIFPFLYILIAVSVFRFIRRRHNQSKRVFNLAALALATLLIVETVSVYPYYMSYFNQSAGGAKNGYRLVTDSNADWGQDLKRLETFLKVHPEIGKIKVDYFGMADLDHYLGGRYEKWWAAKRPIEPGWYAISALFLQEGIYDTRKKDDESYRWLESREPDFQVGTSILIYHITPPEIR